MWLVWLCAISGPCLIANKRTFARLRRVCHVVGCGRDKSYNRSFQAATPAALRHAANASARRSRCVRAETR